VRVANVPVLVEVVERFIKSPAPDVINGVVQALELAVRDLRQTCDEVCIVAIASREALRVALEIELVCKGILYRHFQRRTRG
jgi:hypothetical protein